VQLAMRIGANDFLMKARKSCAYGWQNLMRDLASRDLQRRIEIDDAMSLVVVRVRTARPERSAEGG